MYMDVVNMMGNDGEDGNDDVIEREVDVVVCGVGVGGREDDDRTTTVLLQCPLKSVEGPGYPGTPKVKYKHNVKRMQWEIPLDVESENYDGGVEVQRRVGSFCLKSSRMDGVRGMSVGRVVDGRLFLLPLDGVMQLRPSPQHLDAVPDGREKMHVGGVAAAATAAAAAAQKRDMQLDLQPITVQIKKHETEQQTEARLRSYAFHAQRDEQDEWVDLEYHGVGTEVSNDMMAGLYDGGCMIEEGEEWMQSMGCGEYLDALVPRVDRRAVHEYGDHTAAGDGGIDSNGVGKHMGRPVSIDKTGSGTSIQGVPGAKNTRSVDLSYASSRALRTMLDRLFEQSAVLSMNKIRKKMRHESMPKQLVALGTSGSDEEIHECITSFDDFVFIKHAYTRRLQGDSILDPLRSVVLDALVQHEVVKKGDVFDMASSRGVAVTDTMYIRVMKELCVSKGSSWCMKSGD